MDKKQKIQNALVTSISKKVPLIKTVKAALKKINPSAKLYGADFDKNVIGAYFVDFFWQMPRIEKLDIQDFIQFCQEHQISFIIPTRDGELPFFSYHKKRLQEHGIYVMVSCYESVSVCLDKLLFFQTLDTLHYQSIPTFCKIQELLPSTHFVVKERFGAGAKSIGIDLTFQKAIEHAKTLDNPIFQPFIEGIEISVDLYIDQNKRVKGVVSRTRDLVENGESQITSTKNMPELEKLCASLARDLNLYGHVIFQVIIDRQGDVHVIECNSRFGGASTLSVAVGLDSFYWFFLESLGENLDHYSFDRNHKNFTLVRHPNDYIF